MQPQTFVFFGIIGSGKGTQVERLAGTLKKHDNRECLFTSTGNEYRKLKDSGSYTGSLVKDSMDRGELQPNFLTNTLFVNILIAEMSPEKHFIADGYPRTVVQAENFDQMMKFYNRKNVKIIYIEVSKEEALRRNLARGRHDDTEAGIARRFDEYVNNVLPAMNYLKEKEGYILHTINGEQSRDDVEKDINKALDL